VHELPERETQEAHGVTFRRLAAGGGETAALQVDGVAEVVHDPTRLVKQRWPLLGSKPPRNSQVVR
jgi:hypothetical protein